MSRIKKWVTHNFWLKVFSLILAVATWFYITWQLKKAKDQEQPITKKVTINTPAESGQ